MIGIVLNDVDVERGDNVYFAADRHLTITLPAVVMSACDTDPLKDLQRNLVADQLGSSLQAALADHCVRVQPVSRVRVQRGLGKGNRGWPNLGHMGHLW